MTTEIINDICETLYRFEDDYGVPISKYTYARLILLRAKCQTYKPEIDKHMSHYLHIKNNIRKYGFFCPLNVL